MSTNHGISMISGCSDVGSKLGRGGAGCAQTIGRGRLGLAAAPRNMTNARFKVKQISSRKETPPTSTTNILLYSDTRAHFHILCP